jgi:hypothetical protein
MEGFHNIVVTIPGEDTLVGLYGYNKIMGAAFPNRKSDKEYSGDTRTTALFKRLVKKYDIDLKESYKQD